MATLFSLPGIGVALITTVSPGTILNCLWSRTDRRASADIGSPCEPVVITTTCSGGYSSISSSLMTVSGGNAQIAELAGEVDDVAQRAAEERDLAAEAHRLVDDLLDARHVRGERGDDDAARRAREDRRERLADDALGERVAGAFGVGAESESMQSTPSSPTRAIAREVGGPAVDRRLVELEVAGVEDRADRRAHRQRARAGDAVVDVDELRLDRAVT